MEIDFTKIKELNEEIERQLNERPEFREWWNEVQEILNKVGPQNRLAMSMDLLYEKMFEFTETWEKK